nr:isoflavone reductase like [Quercus suber]
MAQKSKILIIGGTGYIGKYIVEESAKAGHPTFALVRENTASNPEKPKLIESFKSFGVTLLHGDIYHHESLVKAIKQVDVVICALGSPEQIADQVKIIAAIKEAGNIKRFLPSEFGGDVDRIHAVEPIEHHFRAKASIRRSIEAEGVPHTYLVSNGFAGYFLPNFGIGLAGATAPPRDKVEIIGDGNPKVIFSKEEDIATYTIKAVDDPRTLNKVLHVRPLANILSFNEIVSLWEKKIGKTLEKTYLLEDQLLKKIQECSNPLNLLLLSIAHSTFVKGNLRDFEIKASNGVEASELYPEGKENQLWYCRACQLNSSAMSKQRRSGYEPSDKETEGCDSPWIGANHENGGLVSEGLKSVVPRNTSPITMRLNSNRGHSSRFGYEVSSPAKGSKGSPSQRRHNSKSPYRPRRDDGNALALTPLPSLDVRRNVSPFSKAEPARHISPYRPRVEEHNLDKNEFVGSRRKQKNRTPSREENGAHPQLLEA